MDKNSAPTQDLGVIQHRDQTEGLAVGIRAEERDTPKGQNYRLEQASRQYLKLVTSPTEIARLVMVKLPHAKKCVEHGFFIGALIIF